MGQDDLHRVLSKLPEGMVTENLIVGHATSDDAAVLRIDEKRALVQTVDFFTPIVDDPELFGEISATNSVSDVYAMGAEPILALAIAAFPTEKLPLEVLEAILQGGAKKATEAGFPIAGGHTIIDDVPKYGLAVTGIVDIDKIVRNSTARAGDRLYLTKPIGNGILVCAYRALANSQIKKMLRRLAAPSLDEAVEWMTTLNRGAARAMVAAGASAATDVTGYGLAGHLLEMCDGSDLCAVLDFDEIPLLGGVREYLEEGYVPAGSKRNVETFRTRIDTSIADEDLALLCDAQTSGGLLIAISEEREQELVRNLEQQKVFYRKIGVMRDGVPCIEIAHPK